LRFPLWEKVLSAAPAIVAAAIVSHVPDGPATAGALPDAATASAIIESISERVDRLGEAMDIAASVKDTVRSVFRRTEGIDDVVVAAEQMIATNQSIATTAAKAQDSALTVKAGMADATSAIRHALGSARDNVATLAQATNSFSAILGDATSTVQKVSESSEAINAIAREIQLIAVNAGVEAARSGAAGRGFAVIANAVKDLAEQTRAATAETVRQLGALSQVIDRLAGESRESAAKAREATAENEAIDRHLEAFDGFGRAVNRLVGDIEQIARPVDENIRVCGNVISELEHLAEGMKTARQDFGETARRIDGLVDASQDLVGFIAEKAVNTRNGALVTLAMETAGTITRMFEQAVDRGEIGLADLFDDDYRPIPGTDPQQVMTRFVSLTDRLLPAVQEPILSVDPRIAFCAAVDRNGYLPTHNKKFSRPQGHDPVWNAANSRNRRIFNDRTGLAAGRNTKPSLVQTYRRDMGGGQFVLMKDISAPIRVKGRHWGGFRIGVKV
jgi:methyl-accepting chemotaxis protein